MAVFAPMPSARVSTATAVKPGFFSNWRKANFKSFMVVVSTQSSVVRCPSRVRISSFWLPSYFDFELRISFITQRLHRIDSRSAARGKPAGQEHRRGKENACGRKRGRIKRAQTEERRPHHP